MLIHGTMRADTLAGTDAADTIFARGGDDVIFGSPGGDTIYGGGGNDDVKDLQGGESVFAGLGEDDIFGGFNPITAHGNQGNDIIDANGLLFGDKGNDFLQLSSGHAEGGTGSDFLSGSDRLPGFDLAVGHVDLVGGRGADTFSITSIWNDHFQTTDVLDFHADQGDKLRLWAGFADGSPITGPDVDPSTTLASLLDSFHPDGVLDDQDQAAGGAVHVDHAANTITLLLPTDSFVIHGATSLALTEFG